METTSITAQLTDRYDESLFPAGLTDRAADDTTTAQATTELAAMRHRAELAETARDAAERNADDLRTAMRMLEAGPQRRRRWFRSAD